MASGTCQVCGWGSIYARSRCKNCYAYHQRHDGADRPQDLIDAAVRRAQERDAGPLLAAGRNIRHRGRQWKRLRYG